VKLPTLRTRLPKRRELAPFYSLIRWVTWRCSPRSAALHLVIAWPYGSRSLAQLAQHVGPPPPQSPAQPPQPWLGLRVLWASCKPGRGAPAFSWSKTKKVDKLTSEISSSTRVAEFAVRVSPGGPTPAPDEPPASDNAPATPNIVKAFVRPLRFEFLRFEFRLPCDMVEASDFTPALMCNYTTTTAATLDQGGGKRRAGI
jgi:hypothetical protein